MHVIAILGSRNPEGQTAQATDAFLNAAANSGATVSRAFLPSCHLERCRQCDESGWGICRAEGRCVIEDDFAAITAKVRAADVAVFATPVYLSDLSESIRSYLDRLRRVTKHENGKQGIEGKPAIGIAVAGGGGGGAPACVQSMEKILQDCGMDILDLIPVRRQNLDLKRNVLGATGKWVVAQITKS